MIQALSEPSERVSVGFQVVFSLANASALLALMPVLTILVPAQVSRIDTAQTAANLAIVLPAGAVGAFIGNPLGGAMSDRTTSRFGRRRPWILMGSLATAGGLGLLANSYSIIWLAIGWFFVQFFGNILLSSYTAIMPDRVPDRAARHHPGDSGIGLTDIYDRRCVLSGSGAGFPLRLLPNYSGIDRDQCHLPGCIP